MKKILALIMFISFSVSANVAVDEINSILQKKEALKITKTRVPAELKDLQDNYYFVFIFRSTCPHCHNFAPVLKDFTDNFHLKVKSYSIDGKSLPEFKAKRLTSDLFQTYYVNGGFKATVPALYLVNKHTSQAYAALFGEANYYQLANRTHELMKHIKEKYDV